MDMQSDSEQIVCSHLKQASDIIIQASSFFFLSLLSVTPSHTTFLALPACQRWQVMSCLSLHHHQQPPNSRALASTRFLGPSYLRWLRKCEDNPSTVSWHCTWLFWASTPLNLHFFFNDPANRHHHRPFPFPSKGVRGVCILLLLYILRGLNS